MNRFYMVVLNCIFFAIYSMPPHGSSPSISQMPSDSFVLIDLPKPGNSIELIFDKPGGYEKSVHVNPDTILTDLAELVPGTDRYRIANETAIKPAVAAIKLMLAHTAAINAESFEALDFKSSQAKGLILVLAAALRFKSHKEIENRNIVIDFSGIKGFKRGSDMEGYSDRFSGRGGNFVPDETISWDTLNDICKALTGRSDDVFVAAEMQKIAQDIVANTAVQVKPVVPTSIAADQSFSPIIKEAKFNFGKPAGGFQTVNLAADNIEKVLAELAPNVDRFMLGNQFGLTPTKRFIEKYRNITINEIPNLEFLKQEADFNGFMITVASYFRYLITRVSENPNVVANSKTREFFGYQGRYPDSNSFVKWDDMLNVWAKVKEVAAR